MGLFDRLTGRLPRGRRSTYERALDELAEALAAGDHARAKASGARALELGEGLFGATSPELGLPLYGLASAAVSAGDHGEAERLLRRALDEIDRSSDASVGVPRHRLLEMLASIVLRGRADVDATETLLRRWVDACRVADPADPVRLGAALNQLGLLLGRRDKRDEAAKTFDEAAKVRREALGARDRSVAEALFNAATFRPATRPLAEVRADLEACLEMTLDASAESRTLRASVLHNLGAVLEELGASDEARARYEEALEARESVVGRDDASHRPTLVRLAQLHHREGRAALAAPLYDRALDIATRELGPEHAMVRAIEAWKRELHR